MYHNFQLFPLQTHGRHVHHPRVQPPGQQLRPVLHIQQEGRARADSAGKQMQTLILLSNCCNTRMPTKTEAEADTCTVISYHAGIAWREKCLLSGRSKNQVCQAGAPGGLLQDERWPPANTAEGHCVCWQVSRSRSLFPALVTPFVTVTSLSPKLQASPKIFSS